MFYTVFSCLCGAFEYLFVICKRRWSWGLLNKFTKLWAVVTDLVTDFLYAICSGFGDGGWFGNWKCFYRPTTYLTKFRVGVIFAILTLQFLCSNWESTLVNGIGLASFWIFCANFVSDILYGTCGWVWFGNWWC